MNEPWQHHDLTVRGVNFHYVEAGAEANRQLIVLLHGFPEFWYSWRHQIPFLAEAGFHVIAPDMRGYNLTDKSHGVDHYHVEHLTDDIEALIKIWGYERAILIGHDWGGVVAWYTAMRHPALVEKLVILNAPHPAAFMRELRKIKQLFRSWYIFMFQIPILCEAILRANRYSSLRKVLAPAGFSDDEMAKYVESWQRPGALTAMLNYYRAAFRRFIKGSLNQIIRPINVPTLLIWGKNDPALSLRLTEGLEQWVKNLRIERLADSGHFVQNQSPGRVNELMLKFLKENAENFTASPESSTHRSAEERPQQSEDLGGWIADV
jgi:pimeloyl-ACP methyl ester carboxylesterase